MVGWESMRMNGNEGSWANLEETSGQGHFLEDEKWDTQMLSEISRAERKALQAE